MAKARDNADPHGFRQEGKDLLRGVAGGTIFGMPLLYTMEVWQHGLSFHSRHLLGALAVILGLNVVFSFFAGVREHYSAETFSEALEDAVTAVGLGLAIAFVVLWLTGRIDPAQDGWNPIVGKVLLEACVVSVGITFTNFKFRQKGDARQGEDANHRDPGFKNLSNEQKQLRADLNDWAATVAGAFVFAFNVAPTEEVVLIALDLSPAQLLVLLLATIVMAYVILYAAGFKDHKVYEKDSVFQSPFAETAMTVAGALLVAALLLVLIGRPESLASPDAFVACVVALGFPAVVGAAAGRLIV
jgi:putative integral membrane protein (TIGR02587 family)